MQAQVEELRQDDTAAMPDNEIIRHLNAILRNELTGINQYFLHARMLKHMGYVKLADYEYKESIDEMKQSDLLVNRILTLGGKPNLQDIGRLRVGETVEDMLRADLALEEAGSLDLQAAIAVCKDRQDFTSADLLHRIFDNEEAHIRFIREQLAALKTLGAEHYLKTQA